MLQIKTKNTVAQLLAYHLVLVAGAVLVSVFFSLILIGRVFHPGLLSMLVLTFFQLELFVWLSRFFFRGLQPESPRFIWKTIMRLFLFFLSALTIGFLVFMVIYSIQFLRMGAAFSQFWVGLGSHELRAFFKAALIGFGVGTLFFFFVQWNDALKRMRKLREEKLIFQYETLKSQVNPHFLFNSLNTLSSLVATDVAKSEQFIQKLSSVYRYVLENQEKDLVPLGDELGFVRDFFELQQMRDQEKIALKIEMNGAEDARIIPISLQMLVENALKHNLASRNEPLLISIHFEGIDKVVVRNYLQPKSQVRNSQKIGLKNLNERCRLILERETEVQKTADEFVVKVPVMVDVKKPLKIFRNESADH